MAINKKDRLLVLAKTLGRCLYCGVDLTGTKWQADHVHPIIRHLEKGTCLNPELDVIDNLYPTCAPCNHFKSSYTIEAYRSKIQDQFDGVLKYHTGARQLDRLGLLTMDRSAILFWFERQGMVLPTRYQLMGITPLTWKVGDKDESDSYYTECAEGGICYLRYLPRVGWTAVYNKFNFGGRDTTTFNCYSKDDAQLKTTQWLLSM